MGQRVAQDVEEQLFEAMGVTQHVRKARIELGFEDDSLLLGGGPFEQQQFVEDAVQVDGFLAEERGLEGHERFDQPAQAVHLSYDHVRVFDEVFAFAQLAAEELGGAADPGERVVDLVRELGGHAVQLGYAAPVVVLVLEGPQAGHVVKNQDAAGSRRFAAVDHRGFGEHGNPAGGGEKLGFFANGRMPGVETIEHVGDPGRGSEDRAGAEADEGAA